LLGPLSARPIYFGFSHVPACAISEFHPEKGPWEIVWAGSRGMPGNFIRGRRTDVQTNCVEVYFDARFWGFGGGDPILAGDLLCGYKCGLLETHLLFNGFLE
jgi:hypothetical protein